MKKYYFMAVMLTLPYSAWECYKDYSTHFNLLSRGKVVTVEVESYRKGWDQIDYVKYSFVAEDGTVVENHQKTSKPRWYYMAFKVIYDPRDPNTYQEMSDFESYSVGLSVFMTFGILFPVTTFIFGGFLNAGVILLEAIRDDDGRSLGQRLTKHSRKAG